MFPYLLGSILPAVLAGLILAPTLVRSNVLTDLGGLKTSIENTSIIIASPDNPNRGWRLWSPSASPKTADLIMNITTSLLRVKYNLDTDQQSWLNTSHPPTTTFPNSTTPTNLTLRDIDTPYMDYISSIPTLSSALITLGRAWHSEYNRPIYDSIDALQLAMSTFQTALLQTGLIHSNSTLRTIRAGTSLENAQTAWSKPLNLPGNSNAGAEQEHGVHRRGGTVILRATKNAYTPRDVSNARVWEKRAANREPGHMGGFYTHQQLWGRRGRMVRV